MSKATVLRGSAARARDKHHTKCTGHSTTPCNKLVNRTCSYRVLLYIPKVISLSGWLLRDDASTFQYYFSKPVSMELNNRGFIFVHVTQVCPRGISDQRNAAQYKGSNHRAIPPLFHSYLTFLLTVFCTHLLCYEST